MQIKRILLPTDFSEAANCTLPHAFNLAGKYDAHMTVLHVRTLYSDDPNRPEYAYLEEGRFREYIEKALGGAWHAAGSHPKVATAVVRDLNPASAILDFVRDNSVDLTVMGTHGRSGLDRMLLGSTTERVIRIAPCPVLTFKIVGE